MTDKKAQARPAELSETALETAAAGTGHPGGAQFAFGDGSVRYIDSETRPSDSETGMDLPVLNIQRAR